MVFNIRADKETRKLEKKRPIILLERYNRVERFSKREIPGSEGPEFRR